MKEPHEKLEPCSLLRKCYAQAGSGATGVDVKCVPVTKEASVLYQAGCDAGLIDECKYGLGAMKTGEES